MKISHEQIVSGLSTAVPEDIVYIVLAYLQDDKPALSECSLVCRAWLHPSRRYLFHTIALNYVMNGGLAMERRGGLPAFATFLRRCADVRQFLRHLVVSAELWRIANVPDLGPFALEGDDFLAVLEAVANLQHLTLDNVSLVDIDGWTASPPRHALKRLDIQEWIESDEEVLGVLKLIAMFERLDVLTLFLYVNQTFREDTAGLLERHAETGRFPFVRSFVYETSPEWSATPLYRIIERSCQRDRDALTHISFRTWDSTYSWERITEFCRFACNTEVRYHLRELDFHPGSGRTPWFSVPLSDWGVLNLSRLEVLEQLTLALDCENVIYVGEELTCKINAYAFVLRTRSPPALKRLVIKLYIPDNTHEELRRSRLEYIRRVSRKPAWAAFDDALQAFPTPPQVIFDCVGPWEDMIRCGAMGQSLREVLPRTHARGLLRWSINTTPNHWW